MALTLCAVYGLRAQNAPPPTPDTVPIPAAGLPRYLQSLKRVPRPVVIAELSYRVIVAAAPTAASLDAIDALDTLSRACAGSVRPADAPSAYRNDAVAIDGSYLVVIAIPRSTVGDGSCAARWNAEAPSIWRALSIGGSNIAGLPLPRSLRVLIDGAEVKPAHAVALPAYELRNGRWERLSSQLRYYYPMSVVAPTVAASRRTFTLQVWDTRGSYSSFELTSTDVERLRYEYSAWRLASSAAETRPIHLVPRRRVSSAVGDLLALAERGETDAAAIGAAEQLALTSAASVQDYSNDMAAMLVAEALYLHGDTSAARGTIAGVASQRACLRPPAGGSNQLTATTNQLRRGACVAHNPIGTLAAGIMVPGGGHLWHGNRVIGVLAVAALSSVFVSAYSKETSAKKTYAEYQASRSDVKTPTLFDQANARRAAARRRLQVGIALWGADAVIATIVRTAQNRVVSNGRL